MVGKSAGSDSPGSTTPATSSSTSTSSSVTSSTPTNTTPTAPTVSSLAGNYNCTLDVRRNPVGIPNHLPNTLPVEVTDQMGSYRLQSTNPYFIPVMGSMSGKSLLARGRGPYMGYDTEAEWRGSVDPVAGTMNGVYAIGVDGVVWPDAIEWNMSCERTSATFRR